VTLQCDHPTLDAMDMTEEQFEVITRLNRGRDDSRTNAAVRQVMVEGMSVREALEVAEREGRGITRATLNHAVRRYRDADLMLRQAYGNAGTT